MARDQNGPKASRMDPGQQTAVLAKKIQSCSKARDVAGATDCLSTEKEARGRHSRRGRGQW